MTPRTASPSRASDPPPFARWGEPGPPVPRAVALVLHGLNLRPERMRDVTALLSRCGVASLGVALSGHRDVLPGAEDAAAARLEAFRRVSRPLWLGEVRAAYAIARRRAEECDRPLLLVGYSLGAVLGLDLLCEPDADARCDGLLLFAPALRTRWPTHALRLLSPFPRLVIPSFSPASFAANRGTPMAAYNALFASIRALRAHSFERADVPALVLVDPRDELVSYRGLCALREHRGLARWEIDPLERRLRPGVRDYHHLVVAEDRLGPELWGRVSRRVAELLDRVTGERVAAAGRSAARPAP